MPKTAILTGSNHRQLNYPYLMGILPKLDNEYHIDSISLELDFSAIWLYDYIFLPVSIVRPYCESYAIDKNEVIAGLHYAKLEDESGNHIPVHLTDKPKYWLNSEGWHEAFLRRAAEKDMLADYELLNPINADPKYRFRRWSSTERNDFTAEVWKSLYEKGYETIAHFGGMGHYYPGLCTTLQDLIWPHVDRIVMVDCTKREEYVLK